MNLMHLYRAHKQAIADVDELRGRVTMLEANTALLEGRLKTVEGGAAKGEAHAQVPKRGRGRPRKVVSGD